MSGGSSTEGPDEAAGDFETAAALRRAGRLEEALARYDRVIVLRPDDAVAFNNRGNVLLELERFDEALTSYDRAIALKPQYALAFNNRGNALKAMKRYAGALASYDRAIALKPDYAAAFSNRGNVLLDLDDPEAALTSYDLAIAADPGTSEVYSNRGNLLFEMNRFEESLASCDQAIALRPDNASAHVNRGNTLREMKRLDEALASYDRVVALKPDYADALKLRGMCRLLCARYRDGWRDYEWRWETNEFSGYPKIDAPVWQGEDLTGASIAVYAEQGAGDIIQFSRYLPLLVQRGAEVTFLTSPRMLRVLKSLSPKIAVSSKMDAGARPDFQCALMSLPMRFGSEASSIPNEIPYLKAEPALTARWKERLGGTGFKIGIAWQGKPGSRIDRRKWVPLVAFAPLAACPGVRLISLQKTFGLEQLEALPEGLAVESLGDEFDGGPDAFI